MSQPDFIRDARLATRALLRSNFQKMQTQQEQDPEDFVLLEDSSEPDSHQASSSSHEQAMEGRPINYLPISKKQVPYLLRSQLS